MAKNKKASKPKTKKAAVAKKPKAKHVAKMAAKAVKSKAAPKKVVLAKAIPAAKLKAVQGKLNKSAEMPKTKVIVTKAASSLKKSAAVAQATGPTPAGKLAPEKSSGKIPPKAKICAQAGCKEQVQVESFCRLHYMMAYKATELTQKMEASGKIKGMVDDLVSKYPDEYLDVVKEDLANDKSFRDAIQDLSIDTEEFDIDSIEGGSGIDNE